MGLFEYNVKTHKIDAEILSVFVLQASSGFCWISHQMFCWVKPEGGRVKTHKDDNLTSIILVVLWCISHQPEHRGRRPLATCCWREDYCCCEHFKQEKLLRSQISSACHRSEPELRRRAADSNQQSGQYVVPLFEARLLGQTLWFSFVHQRTEEEHSSTLKLIVSSELFSEASGDVWTEDLIILYKSSWLTRD